jgi:hypothetical protein
MIIPFLSLCGAKKGMSALPPKADMCGATTDVRFGLGLFATFYEY